MRKLTELRFNMMSYIEEHPGCTKEMIMSGVGMTIHQVHNSFMHLRSSIKSVMIGKGRGRTGTYYAEETEFKPSITGGRIVKAGDILRKKYGVFSPDLRRVAHSGIRSYMEGVR
jgi:hypothetical protein